MVAVIVIALGLTAPALIARNVGLIEPQVIADGARRVCDCMYKTDPGVFTVNRSTCS